MQGVPEPALLDQALQALAVAGADLARSDQILVDLTVAQLGASCLAKERMVDLVCGPGSIRFRLAEALTLLP